jgi:hypothetical protein
MSARSNADRGLNMTLRWLCANPEQERTEALALRRTL